MIDLCLKHTMYSWSATGTVNPMPISSAKGVYLYGPEGQKWLDWLQAVQNRRWIKYHFLLFKKRSITPIPSPNPPLFRSFLRSNL